MTGSAAAPAHVRFEGGLTLRTIVDAKARLLDALAANEAVVIDWSAATEVDVSGAQLLLAAFKSAAQAGKQIRFAPPTPAVLHSVIAASGLAEAFEDLTGGATSKPVPVGEA
jgi:anti-anti-sigma regulatory factor